MKIKRNIESCIYVVMIALCLIILMLVAASTYQFSDTKIIYQGF